MTYEEGPAVASRHCCTLDALARLHALTEHTGGISGRQLTPGCLACIAEGAPNYGEMVKKAPAWLEVNPLVEAGILDISADTYRVSIGAAEAFAGLGLL